jgi:predicted nucleic acid-binding protein
MNGAEPFIDTNVLLYLLSADSAKAERAEQALAQGGTLNVQVLNEFASVASRKLRMRISEIREVLSVIRAMCRVLPITEQTHDAGMQIAEQYGLSVFDAMLVASATLAGCKAFLSEDLQHGQKFAGGLSVRNPFR